MLAAVAESRIAQCAVWRSTPDECRAFWQVQGVPTSLFGSLCALILVSTNTENNTSCCCDVLWRETVVCARHQMHGMLVVQ